jgi:hypothetical protein
MWVLLLSLQQLFVVLLVQNSCPVLVLPSLPSSSLLSSSPSSAIGWYWSSISVTLSSLSSTRQYQTAVGGVVSAASMTKTLSMPSHKIDDDTSRQQQQQQRQQQQRQQPTPQYKHQHQPSITSSKVSDDQKYNNNNNNIGETDTKFMTNDDDDDNDSTDTINNNDGYNMILQSNLRVSILNPMILKNVPSCQHVVSQIELLNLVRYTYIGKDLPPLPKYDYFIIVFVCVVVFSLIFFDVFRFTPCSTYLSHIFFIYHGNKLFLGIKKIKSILMFITSIM